MPAAAFGVRVLCKGMQGEVSIEDHTCWHPSVRQSAQVEMPREMRMGLVDLVETSLPRLCAVTVGGKQLATG